MYTLFLFIDRWKNLRETFWVGCFDGQMVVVRPVLNLFLFDAWETGEVSEITILPRTLVRGR